MAEAKLDSTAAMKVVEKLTADLEASYEDGGIKEDDEIWVKFVVGGKKKHYHLEEAAKGTSLSQIAEAMVPKEVCFFVVIVRGNDEDGPLRTYRTVFLYQAESLSVSQRGKYSFNKNSVTEMNLGASINEQVDREAIEGGWPMNNLQTYLKKVKVNAGAHSVANYCFGADEKME